MTGTGVDEALPERPRPLVLMHPMAATTAPYPRPNSSRTALHLRCQSVVSMAPGLSRRRLCYGRPCRALARDLPETAVSNLAPPQDPILDRSSDPDASHVHPQSLRQSLAGRPMQGRGPGNAPGGRRPDRGSGSPNAQATGPSWPIRRPSAASRRPSPRPILALSRRTGAR
jgi:hypothetical protein